MTPPTPLTLTVAGTSEEIRLCPSRLVVAGYTARDQTSVAHHIAELAAIGVPPPASVPAFYDLDPHLLTSDAVIEVDAPATSGEVEPVIVRQGGRYFLAVGSDHTDRDLERADIAASKAACPKPIGTTVARIGSDLTALDWDRLCAESAVDDQNYQHGSVATLRHPAELLERMEAVLGPVTGDLVLFCGTFPLITGAFVHGSAWQMCLAMPDGTTLTHRYETKLRSK